VASDTALALIFMPATSQPGLSVFGGHLMSRISIWLELLKAIA
jgi:hypothetical protein